MLHPRADTKGLCAHEMFGCFSVDQIKAARGDAGLPWHILFGGEQTLL
jgi:hypothetical protein